MWVSCRGENQSDREIIGPISYFPTRGFPAYYYPYKNTQNYLSPLIAVQFVRPSSNSILCCSEAKYLFIFKTFSFIFAEHSIINIECRAWAKNVLYNGSYRDRQGSVHFELMID